MKYVLTDKKVVVPDTLRAYAEKKIGKLERYFKTDAVAYVTFDVERGRHVVEITIHTGSLYFRVSEKTTDMYASIDAAVAAIEKQIHKNKSRLEKRLRQDAFDVSVNPLQASDDDEKEDEINIVRVKKFSIKPMTAEEAVLQMNLLDHEFFVFKNADSEEHFSVVYRRNDGGYGLIESGSDYDD